MNGRAFLRPRDTAFWAYLAVLGAALFWRGPHELAGASGGTFLLWTVLAFAGAALVAAFGWALDPHATLPRSLLGGGLGWGAACAVLAAETDRATGQLLVKMLGLANGGALARWLAMPSSHDVLAVLGVFLLLSLAGERALRPTDGMKIGMSCGLGMWSGQLLLALAHGAADNPGERLAGSLAVGLPHWFALAAAPWAAPAIAGYGLAAARDAAGATKLRRLAVATAAVLGSAALACLFDGVARAAFASVTNGWAWVWAVVAGFGFASAVLRPIRSRAWQVGLGLGLFGVVSLCVVAAPWPLFAMTAFSPLALLGLWRKATRAEGAWLAAALSDEADDVRSGCADSRALADVTARLASAKAALASFGPKARPLAVRLRSGQIRLANSKELLAAEREAAGPKPDPRWRAWLAHLSEEIDAQRGAVRATVADMAREKGVYQ
ncbi:MAG: hypothetical protein ACRC20_08900 [Segniliparus sp.]|uniref:hypothetical protein n=1 Tax=Segniliparus sp. TaxID=2804064 RepID=UPI003F33D3C9